VDISQTFVKRVIGQPGDHIKIVNQIVYRNGVKLNEPYVYHKNPYPDSFRDNFPSSEPNLMLLDRAHDMLANSVINGEIVVPASSYFAMGDNRDNSLDSRYWGFVPRENIIGKPLIIYWSYDASTESLASSSVNTLLRHFVDLGEHFFTKTRWSRTFRLIHGYYGPF
jgi:signal peptidase I